MKEKSMLTTLIADENPQGRVLLRRLLEMQNVQILAEVESGFQILQTIEETHPSLLFMDIRMPGLNGLQVAGALRHIENAPLLIFVTDCSDYAVEAFEQDALDYLIKPVTPERLAKTLLRARQRLHQVQSSYVRTPVMQTQVSQTTLQETQPLLKETQPFQSVAQALPQINTQPLTGVPLRRLPVKENYAVRLIRVEEIVCVLSREKRSYVRTSLGEFRTSYTLTQLETLLPIDSFYRIHDSCIVNLELVDEVLFMGNHSYAVQLSNGLELPIGRTRFGEVQRRLGMNNINLS